jgi:hypothetical protein
MKKQSINEHDLTKKMIDVLRFGLLKEDVNPEQTDDQHDEGSDVITPTQGDTNYKNELKKFSDQVDGGFTVTKFKIYPKDYDVQFEGRLNSGINFFMSTKVGKLKISITDNNGQAIETFVDDEILQIIQRLVNYEKNWRKEWNEKIRTEYKKY